MTLHWQTGIEISETVQLAYEDDNFDGGIDETKEAKERFVSEYDLRSLLADADKANPCMKCGSVQCAICSKDLERELWGEETLEEHEKDCACCKATNGKEARKE